jgi:hypothetical protein
MISILAFTGESAEDRFPYPENEEIRLRVARVSFVGGGVALSRGDDPGVWRAVTVNEPLANGDRLYSGRDGRVELELPGGNLVGLGPQSEMSVLNLVEGGSQLAVRSGVASFFLRRLLDGEAFEVDTPGAAVTLQQAGEYRLEAVAGAAAGVLAVVRRGTAVVAAGGGELSVGAGRQVRVTGTEAPRYDFEAARAPDAFDGWAEERSRRFREVRSSAMVNSEVVGVADLDEAGHWENTRDFGNAWTPSNVDKDWQPYRAGRWLWQDPWGWTWVSEEPWGWAPYHYGRWAVYPTGWFWVPASSMDRYVSYSPALVAFLGGGTDGATALGFRGGEDVGWFPLALADPFYPWWIPRANVHLTRATEFIYRNRRSVIVIPTKVFASGELVRAHLVRDAAVLDEALNGPVLRVPLPLLPTEQSLGGAAGSRTRRVEKPPAAILARPVVVRAALPPGPPSFSAKLEVIREHRSAPVPPSVAIRIREADGRNAGAREAVVPAVRSDGRMTLVPRHADAATPLPQPIRAAAAPSPPTTSR